MKHGNLEWRKERSVSAQVFDSRNKNKMRRKTGASKTMGQFVGEMEWLLEVVGWWQRLEQFPTSDGFANYL